LHETLCFRPWDSTFFDLRIFEAHVRFDSLAKALREAQERRADCVYLFVGADDLPSVEAAIRAGARLVDLRVELVGDVGLEPVAGMKAARRATSADRGALLAQSALLARESRFARDDRFSFDRVRQMYEITLDRCLDEGVVSVPANELRGFVGARRTDEGVRIDLVFVDPAHRRTGVGRALVQYAAAALDATTVSVVTQAGNIGGQRLYQSLGLRSNVTVAVLHFWLDRREGGRSLR
jgi:ribosomal protein S18 acetylase RimI-like enzyme